MMKKRYLGFHTMVHIVLAILTISFLLPFLIVLSVSISNEAQITDYGFSIIPKIIDFTAYKMIFSDFSSFGRSLCFTAFVAVLSPILACIVQALIAYALAQDDFEWRTPINWYLILTMFFSAGTIPTYVIYTKVYHLGNNPLIYFVGLAGAWSIILYRTFFKEIPPSLIESARIDGASELQTIWYIVVPMAKAIFAMQYVLGMIGQWNNYGTSLMYISDEKWMTVQHVMQRALENVNLLRQSYAMLGASMKTEVPVMTMRYAMLVVSLIPIFIVFPYAQRYFSKGMTVGSVKG